MLLAFGERATAERIPADPTNYLALLQTLMPGDVLELQPGVYAEGLPVYYLEGTSQQPIVIRGSVSGQRPVFLGSDDWNTVRIRESAYVEIKNLELDGLGKAGDGVNADGNGDWAHHITIENLFIHGYDADQSIVAISTNGCTTWGWTISRNIIEGAGTGMYLGNSPGNNPFVGGLIEYNLVQDTIGYNIQIKQQDTRPEIPALPSAPHRTVIRHNVLSKANNASSGADARPNLLVGHFPLSGPGTDDFYEIYGNFFYQNPGESLFQGEGNIAIFANVMINTLGPAITIQPHNDLPRTIRVFNNTIISTHRGIRVANADPSFSQIVSGNAVFANPSIEAGQHAHNVAHSYESASEFLSDPFLPIGGLDVYPLIGTLKHGNFDAGELHSFTDSALDFNGRPYDRRFRGAYSGEGVNPGWTLELATKAAAIGDELPPSSPSDLITD